MTEEIEVTAEEIRMSNDFHKKRIEASSDLEFLGSPFTSATKKFAWLPKKIHAGGNPVWLIHYIDATFSGWFSFPHTISRNYKYTDYLMMMLKQ